MFGTLLRPPDWSIDVWYISATAWSATDVWYTSTTARSVADRLPSTSAYSISDRSRWSLKRSSVTGSLPFSDQWRQHGSHQWRSNDDRFDPSAIGAAFCDRHLTLLRPIWSVVKGCFCCSAGWADTIVMALYIKYNIILIILILLL